MNSGLKVSDEIKATFDKLRLSKTLKAMIIKINDQGELEIEKTFPVEGFEPDCVKDAISDDESRYAIVDVSYKKDDGSIESKIVFCLFCSMSKIALFT